MKEGMLDQSNGYEAIAANWIRERSHTIGPRVVLEWARKLPAGTAVLDLGCGNGVPMAAALIEAGFDVHGVDAAPTMIAAFRARFPGAPAECCAAEESACFGRGFDGVMSWGLIFLLAPERQRQLIARVAQVLNPGGRFLFTAPWQTATWHDASTGRVSYSLGREEYHRQLAANGLMIEGDATDEGQNYYYMAVKTK